MSGSLILEWATLAFICWRVTLDSGPYALLGNALFQPVLSKVLSTLAAKGYLWMLKRKWRSCIPTVCRLCKVQHLVLSAWHHGAWNTNMVWKSICWHKMFMSGTSEWGQSHFCANTVVSRMGWSVVLRSVLISLGADCASFSPFFFASIRETRNKQSPFSMHSLGLLPLLLIPPTKSILPPTTFLSVGIKLDRTPVLLCQTCETPHIPAKHFYLAFLSSQMIWLVFPPLQEYKRGTKDVDHHWVMPLLKCKKYFLYQWPLYWIWNRWIYNIFNAATLSTREVP